MKDFSYITNSHPAFIEETYKAFVQDPSSIDPDLKKFFEGFDFFQSNYGDQAASEGTLKEFKVIDLINAYRIRGHLFTQTNPVRERRKYRDTC